MSTLEDKRNKQDVNETLTQSKRSNSIDLSKISRVSNKWINECLDQRRAEGKLLPEKFYILGECASGIRFRFEYLHRRKINCLSDLLPRYWMEDDSPYVDRCGEQEIYQRVVDDGEYVVGQTRIHWMVYSRDQSGIVDDVERVFSVIAVDTCPENLTSRLYDAMLVALVLSVFG